MRKQLHLEGALELSILKAPKETYAVDFGMHDIEYFRQMLHFLRCPQSSPTIIYEENESSISMLSRLI